MNILLESNMIVSGYTRYSLEILWVPVKRDIVYNDKVDDDFLDER